ncbi:hypothetical protein FA95DRAFT_1581713 [Auriscalpium vulgare]|uniref:Uncharacterized protein n=1 Tax=Auriscalpium vulgare TaxID=40419 RepID=A0ACB8S069_9AGAM|nr:hypothetical protein FA95DRAFT_1581713 [Auriscalpium vulgare]
MSAFGGGSTFGSSTATQQPGQSGGVFGGLGSSTVANPQATQPTSAFGGAAQGGTFGSGGGLFGSTAGQGQQAGGTGGVFGGGGGLFGGAGAAAQQQQQPSGGGLFGTASGQQQQPQASGGLFGTSTQQQQQPQQPQQTGGGLFGGGSTTQSTGTGGLFSGGTQQGGTSGGLFGSAAANPSGQQSGTGGLFGGGNQQQPASTGGGLFGTSTTGQQNGTGTGGLFGSTTNQPGTTGTGGLFGNAGVGTSTGGGSGTGGLFGSTTGQSSGGGLFGGGLGQNQAQQQQQQQQQQPQQQQGGLFGSTTQGSGLLGGSLLGGGQASQNSLFASRSTAAPAQQQADSQTQFQQLSQRIEAIVSAWNPNSPANRFQHYFYNLVDPTQVHLYGRPANATDEALWQRAGRENPDPSCLVPVLATSFDDLQKRVEAQTQQATAHQDKLKEIRSRIEKLSERHELSNAARLNKAHTTQAQLTHRLLKLVQHLHLLIPSLRSSSIRPEEEALRAVLEEIDSEVRRPGGMGRIVGKLNELWALVGSLQAVRSNSRGADGVEWAVVDEDGLGQIVQILAEQQAGLAHLTKILQKGLRDTAVIYGEAEVEEERRSDLLSSFSQSLRGSTMR